MASAHSDCVPTSVEAPKSCHCLLTALSTGDGGGGRVMPLVGWKQVIMRRVWATSVAGYFYARPISEHLSSQPGNAADWLHLLPPLPPRELRLE